ncbi:hypothetical protein NDU88_003562 [Pleurodeles waltl]|uniref:Uncharacterized protein n=1 Tax=Pleurodeles waltl TaxID=8319 RepID=A0AAV7W5F9_PLEWA|nr:hypothetical protein NDU88_003562 [Pleurodeles waltl]
MDAAAQDVISEALGAYQHTHDRLAQIISTLEHSLRMQQEHHQEAMEQWKQHNATMASMAGALLQVVQTQSETHPGQKAPTTAQETDRTMTPSAATFQELHPEETQGTTMSSPLGQQQAPKRTLRSR